jgi:hypothetical protein
MLKFGEIPPLAMLKSFFALSIRKLALFISGRFSKA